MALIDRYHIETMNQLLSQAPEVDNRAVWKDGSPISTQRIFGVVHRYDLQKEFPALNLRPVPLKLCFNEIDWLYIQRSNNVNDLEGHIWDDWADEDGSIGLSYGYQINKPVGGYASQIHNLLGEIERNPTSRRLIIELWNVDDLKRMNLPACCHHLQVFVKDGKANLLLKQRSSDFVTAGAFNVCEYAIFIHMVARHCGLEVGELIHVIGDCHLYNKHIEHAEVLKERTPQPAPTLWINPEKTNFFSFTKEDFRLDDYHPHPQIKGIEVAV